MGEVVCGSRRSVHEAYQHADEVGDRVAHVRAVDRRRIGESFGEIRLGGIRAQVVEGGGARDEGDDIGDVGVDLGHNAGDKDDVGDAVRTFVDFLHGPNHVAHHCSPLHGNR